MINLTIHPLIPHSQQSGVTSNNVTENQSTTFGDMLEIINPLQHLPVVSHFYRAETGNNIPAIAKVIGGGLLGGVVGAVGAAAVSVLEGVMGEPILQTAANALEGETQHQPFASGTMQVVSLNPDNEAIYDEQMLNALQNINQPKQIESQKAEQGLNLRDLRKSEIGLPEYGVEAQFQSQLDAKLVKAI
jgi:hypothetical protein